MKISIIGYKNHSVRLQNLLDSTDVKATLWNYHTDSFSELIDSDCILISSPNHTHVNYINKIFTHKPNCYVLCEKPPAIDINELSYLTNLSEDLKERIFFNFNYRFSHLTKLVKKKDFGKPIHFNFVSSHGLAFKDSFKNNWRFSSGDSLMGVYGTVAIHYLDLCNWLFGDYEYLDVKKHNYSNCKSHDSITINMKFENGCTVNIFVSYVTPFINKSELIFDNAILELDNGIIKLYEPRDSFGTFYKTTRGQNNDTL